MANEWISSGGKACYNTATPGFELVQPAQFTAGLYYIVKISVSGTTQGKVVIESIEGKPEFTADGDYVVYGKATQTSLAISGQLDGYGDLFDGCIDNIQSRWTPLYRVEDGEGNIIFEQTNNDDVDIAGNNIQYGVDWTEIEAGTYKIKFTDGPLEYETYCLCVKVDPCSILISWTNDENAGGFNYSDLDFTQNLRVQGKLRDVFGKSIQRDVFRFSDGSKQILYAERDQEQQLIIREMPAYLHRALMLGIDYDHFKLNGAEYIVDQEDYNPKWRNSSNLAPVELTVTPKNEGFINQNCS